MDYLIVGTAGHVDHGKTTLVRALTGVDTDRLEEEKKRGITIELGFAKWQLSDNLVAGIIDVPGHERFIKNMLAGSGGMDLVMLVIAADEGVMPQTKEHMAILDLLGIENGLIVLTKCDMVDEEWLTLVEEEVRENLKSTFLAKAPIMKVSAKTGSGIEELREEVKKLANKREKAKGPLHLPIDRVFSMTGFGTVITGTLLAGTLNVGDLVELIPSGQTSRIRSLEVHGESVKTVGAGHRTAVNLADLEVEDIDRGMVLAEPGKHQATCFLDVRLEYLKDALRPLKHRERIRFYLGSSEVMGRVYLLDEDSLEPGQTGLAQLRLEKEVFALNKERFVIRSYSPLETIGGGTIIDIHPKQHKRFREKIIQEIELKEEGTLSECLWQEIEMDKRILRRVVDFESDAPEKEKQAALDELCKDGVVTKIEKYYLATDMLEKYTVDLKNLLTRFHEDCPWKKGYQKELARSKVADGLKPKLFQTLLDHWEEAGWLTMKEGFLRLADYKAVWQGEDLKIKEKIEKKYLAGGFSSPSKDELALSKKEEEIWQAMLDTGVLVALNENIAFLQVTLDEGAALIKKEAQGEFTASDFRNWAGTSRKYAIPLLEYYDSKRLTRRNGDKRILF